MIVCNALCGARSVECLYSSLAFLQGTLDIYIDISSLAMNSALKAFLQ